MAIHRAPRPATHYTTIRNDVLRDDRLSFRAAGILATILSHTDDWQTSTESLASRGKEGRDAIRTALTELEDAGYLKRERRQDERGRWSTQAVIYDEPQRQGDGTVQGDLFAQVTPTTDSQASVNQASENPASVSQAITEHPSKNPVPSERSLGPADQVATVAYEALDKMGNFMALRAVAAKALKAGHEQPKVEAAMVALVGMGKPITGSTMHAQLGAHGATMTSAHTDHWQAGGEFNG